MWQVNYNVELMKGFCPLFLRKGKQEKKALGYLKGAKFPSKY